MPPEPKQEHAIELTPGMSADELVAAVLQNGHSLCVVRDGKAIVRIERIRNGEAGFDRARLALVATDLEELSRTQTLGPNLSLRDLVDEGRE